MKIKVTAEFLHYPEGQPDGPWGVDTIGRDWCVINKLTGRSKKVGRVIGFTTPAKSKFNYFDRALEEARKRNLK